MGRPRGGTSRGKQKIEIRFIEDKSRREVSFSKRRAGLFKKASELRVLCGASVAVLSVSMAGKEARVRSMVDKVAKAKAKAKAGRQFWWEADVVEALGEAELPDFAKALERFRHSVCLSINKLQLSTTPRQQLHISDYYSF
uniref:MADS-box domain-containing protein n=1 Tax=Oryza brachyantha TaxID=4533 RepID=J3MEH4_ORYBR